MASITLKDYLISLSTKGSISNGDLLPLLDSDSSNAIKTITKGTLVNLSDIDGFAEFSSSVQGDIFALSFASGATVETSLQQQIDLNNLGVYTQSLKNAITVDGNDVQIIGELRADKFYVNYITSSVSLLTGSNEFGDTLADRHTFIGDVYINGDGPIGLLQLNTQTGSQNSINSGVSAVTGAFAIELGSIDSHILGVSQQSSSQGLINTGISAVTGAFATELGQLQNNVTDFTNVLSGVAAVSGAIVTELGGIQNNITSFNGVFGGVSAVTGAFATELGQLQTQNTSQGGVNTGISAVTGAFATELGEIQTQLTNRRGELNGLEAYTASLKSVGLISSSAQISVEISGSGFTSASGEFEELTLTRGDGTTAQVDLSPRKVLELVKNKESQTLPKGTPVYVSGSTGNAAHIYAASASRADRMPAAFVLNQELAFDAEGYGIVVGYINGVNTSTFNEGDEVYVGASGGYTNVKPTGNSNRIQKLGNVIEVHATNGSVITGAGRSNDVPNIQEGYMWVGGPNDVSYQLSTSSLSSYTDSDNLSYLNSLLVVSKSAGGDLDVNGAITASNANFTGTLSYGSIDSDLENSGNIKRQILFFNPVSKRLLRNGGGHLQFQPGPNLLWATNVTSSNVEVSGDITASNGEFTNTLSVGTTDLNNRIFRVYGSGDIAQFTSTNPGVGGAQIDITHESATPADGDNIGIINFGGFDTGLNATQYANIKAIVSSVGSEIGELHFGTRENSSTYNGSNMILDGAGNLEVAGDISGSNVSINDILTLTPRTTTPTSPQSGSFIVSGSGATIKPFFYDGNQWQEISFV